jgi:hypothetical protein
VERDSVRQARPARDPRKRRRRRLAALAVLLGVVAIGITWARRARREDGAPVVSIPGLGAREVRAPEGVRVRVEVLNATRTRGLARRATRHLRDRGFDVVGMGTSADALDSTVVIDRTGHPEWARLVAGAMGGGRVVVRPDSSRHLDITVLVGASWRPPAETLYP